MANVVVPNDKERAEAVVLGERILECIRRDESILTALVGTDIEDALWMLSSTLVYWRDHGVDRPR